MVAYSEAEIFLFSEYRPYHPAPLAVRLLPTPGDFLLQILRMKILFIGGTGIISTACTALAAQRGFDLTLLTRGKRSTGIPHGVRVLTEDVNNPALPAKLANEKFDAIVDWTAFTSKDIERDINLFRGR